MSGPLQRARDNAVGLVSTLVTGIWLAALVLGFDWWLGFMLFGYIVVVPVTTYLFGEDERDTVSGESSDEDDALETLRQRYARGDLTDEQFERKLDRLLEVETLEDAEDEKRRAEREFAEE